MSGLKPAAPRFSCASRRASSSSRFFTADSRAARLLFVLSPCSGGGGGGTRWYVDAAELLRAACGAERCVHARLRAACRRGIIQQAHRAQGRNALRNAVLCARDVAQRCNVRTFDANDAFVPFLTAGAEAPGLSYVDNIVLFAVVCGVHLLTGRIAAKATCARPRRTTPCAPSAAGKAGRPASVREMPWHACEHAHLTVVEAAQSCPKLLACAGAAHVAVVESIASHKQCSWRTRTQALELLDCDRVAGA